MHLSNTFMFEKDLDWSGLLIEASPVEAKKLLSNAQRPKSIKVNAVIGDREDTVTWIDLTGELELISTVKELSSAKHLQRIEKELKRFSSERKTEIPVNMTKLSTLFDNYGITHVNLFSLDVEGAELSVLKSIDWGKVVIDVLCIEISTREQRGEINAFLLPKGLLLIAWLHSFMRFHLTAVRCVFCFRLCCFALVFN